MPNFRVSTAPRYLRPQYHEIVVPPTTYATQVDFGIIKPTLGHWVDTVLAKQINDALPRYRIQRVAAPRGELALHLVLASDPYLAAAPSTVQSLAAALPPTSADRYVYYGGPGRDVWIVARRVEGLRHGAIDFLEQNGVEYLLPGPLWVRVRTTGFESPERSEIVEPRLELLSQGVVGGWKSNPGAAAGMPGQEFAADDWEKWWINRRFPREFTTGDADGESGALHVLQRQLRADHTYLHWDEASSSRGPNFPFNECFPTSNPLVNTRSCPTHNGTSGAWPTAPEGPTPWLTYSGSVPTVLCVVGEDETAQNDPGPDNNANPSLGNWTAFGGILQLKAEYHRNSACANIAALGVTHPATKFVSIAPADGAASCWCDKCLTLLQPGSPWYSYLKPEHRGLAPSGTDKLVNEANFVLKTLNIAFANSPTAHPGVGFSAYVEHGAPPRIPIGDPADTSGTQRFRVSVLPSSYFQSSNRQPVYAVQDWCEHRDWNPLGTYHIGVQPIWVTGQGSYDRPTMSPAQGTSDVKRWMAAGADHLQVQSTGSSLAAGLQFLVVSRLAWKADTSTRTEIEKVIDLLEYPTVQAPIRILIERWMCLDESRLNNAGEPPYHQHFEVCPHDLAVQLRNYQAAQDALDAIPDADPMVQLRLDQIAATLHHQRLYLEWEVASYYAFTGSGDTLSEIDAYLAWCARMMAGTNDFERNHWVNWDRNGQTIRTTIPAGAAGDALRAKYNFDNAAATGWPAATGATYPTTADLRAIIAQDILDYAPISGVSTTRPEFSDTLTPLFNSSDNTIEYFPNFADTITRYRFQAKATTTTLTVAVRNNGPSDGALPMRVEWSLLNGAWLQTDEIPHNPAGSFVFHTISLPTVVGQQYEVTVANMPLNRMISALGAPRALPMVMLGVNMNVQREFDYTRKFYFAIKDQTKICLTIFSGSRIIQFYQHVSGSDVALTTTRHDPYTWTAPITPNGFWQVCAFTGWQTPTQTSQPWPENFPRYFSPHPDMLMVPVS